MRFNREGGPDDVLEAGTFVDGVYDSSLEPHELEGLRKQRSWHKKRGHRTRLVPFMWGGRIRFGEVSVDLDPGR